MHQNKNNIFKNFIFGKMNFYASASIQSFYVTPGVPIRFSVGNSLDLLYYKVFVVGLPILSCHIEIIHVNQNDRKILPCKLYPLHTNFKNELQHREITLVKICTKDTLIDSSKVYMIMTLSSSHLTNLNSLSTPQDKKWKDINVFNTGYNFYSTIAKLTSKCGTVPHSSLYSDVKVEKTHKLEYFSVNYRLAEDYYGYKNYTMTNDNRDIWSGRLQFIILILDKDVNVNSTHTIAVLQRGRICNFRKTKLELDMSRKIIMKVELDIVQPYVILPICSLDAYRNNHIMSQYSTLGWDEYANGIMHIEIYENNKIHEPIKITNIILCISNMSTKNTKDQVFINMKRVEKMSNKNNIKKKLFGRHNYEDVKVICTE